ncbi:hypothetical protein KU6B_48170 [Mameliella alba]|uniref:hypothetical protein n=1 Tax=Mameliella alba TaxID=561184 RepID=UPI0013E460A3|nr:hypothetical protein [Mameliella alba]BBU58552.1 hypothetical protein KU6B_48170 [Mameliella alba]
MTSLIDQIKADRASGTEGPWGYGRTGEEQRLILSQGGKGRYVCNVQIFQTPRHMGLWEEDSREANARRIARLPDLEAAYIREREAAEEHLITTLEAIARGDDSLDGMAGDMATAALTAYRAAVEETAA